MLLNSDDQLSQLLECLYEILVFVVYVVFETETLLLKLVELVYNALLALKCGV